MSEAEEIPLWEVFIRPRNGLAHRHCGSLHAADAEMALQAARDVYTRRGEGCLFGLFPQRRLSPLIRKIAACCLIRPMIKSIATRAFTTFQMMWGICDARRMGRRLDRLGR